MWGTEFEDHFLINCLSPISTLFLPAADRTFKMGSPTGESDRGGDEFQHDVTLTEDYYMQVTEVTQAQRRAVWDAADAAGVSIPPGRNPSAFSGCNDCPVESVSRDDADRFIHALNRLDPRGYTLPTEARWEYAARAGTTTPYSFGETLTTDQANYDNYYGATTPAGTFDPNGYGLYDMNGNVWEWEKIRTGS